jgi:hypothetical protein
MDDLSTYGTRDGLRACAAGTLAWAMLRARGVTYRDVLAGLGDLGLRRPLAPMKGPNVEARERGTRRLRELLARRRP